MNFFVGMFGGQEGCIGALYTPTMQERLKAENRKLTRLKLKLNRELGETLTGAENAKHLATVLVKTGKMERAKAKALDVLDLQNKYSSLRVQYQTIVRISSKMDLQTKAVDIDRSMKVLVNVMAIRMNVNEPEKCAKMLCMYDKLQLAEEMNEDQLEDFFSAGEMNESERAAEATDRENDRLRDLFQELGIPNISNPMTGAPDTPLGDPNTNSRGGGGGGGRAPERAAPPAAKKDKPDVSGTEEEKETEAVKTDGKVEPGTKATDKK